MKSTLRLAFVMMLIAFPASSVPTELLKIQDSFASVADRVMPTVVNITTIHFHQVPELQYYFAPEQYREYKSEGVGSGVIIDADGLVLTNEHVVRGADEIKVVLYGKDGKKQEYSGRVVGKDSRTDIAVVRISAGHKLPFATLGDSDKVSVGDWAIAIGSPFGLSQTFTVGVISAARQSFEIGDRRYMSLIQTDAAINRGNSGGPLLNIKGEVVGINTAIFAPTGVFAGIGFAVPINQAKAILDELVKKGRVVRGWLGVEMASPIPQELVARWGLPDTRGALVTNVLANSPAERAGFVRGDVVRSLNGKSIESADTLQTLVMQTPPKKKVEVIVWRERKNVTLGLIMGERPDFSD